MKNIKYNQTKNNMSYNIIKQKIEEINKDNYCYYFILWTSSDFGLSYLFFDSLRLLLEEVSTKAVEDINEEEVEIPIWDEVLTSYSTELGVIHNMSEEACEWLMKTEDFTYFEKRDFILKTINQK